MNKSLLIVLNLIKNVQIKTFVLEFDSAEASSLPIRLPLFHRILQNQKHRNLSPYWFRQNHLLRTSPLLCRQNRIHPLSQRVRQCWSHYGLHGTLEGKRNHHSVSCHPPQMERLRHQPHWYTWTYWLYNWSWKGSESFGWWSFAYLWCCWSAASNSDSEQADDEI